MSDPSLTHKRLTPGLLLLLFPLLGLIAAAIVVVSNQPGRTIEATPAAVTLPPMPTQAQVMGEPAPDFELRTLDETTVKLSDFRGRPVFLNFWATWCEPCKRELPTFQAFMESQPDDGPIILAVDIGETYDTVNAYLDDLGVSGFPVLLDVRYEASDLYAIGPIPVTFVINEEGVISAAKYGEMKPEDLTDYLAALVE